MILRPYNHYHLPTDVRLNENLIISHLDGNHITKSFHNRYNSLWLYNYGKTIVKKWKI